MEENENVEIEENVDKSSEDLIQEHLDNLSNEETKDGDNDASAAEGEKGSDAGEDQGEAGEEKPETPESGKKEGIEDEIQASEEKETSESNGDGSEAYTPDLTFNSLREEHSMPEELASVIKNKEQEEYYRKIFHRAHSFDFVQERRERAESQLEQYDQTFNTFMKDAQVGDFKKAWTEVAGLPAPTIEQVLQGFGFNDRQLIEHAYNVANQTPQEREAHAAQFEGDRKYRELEMKVQDMEQAQQTAQERQVFHEYDQLTADQEFGPVIRAFEEKNGQGSFFQEVVNRGLQVSQEQGRILGPKAIAKDLISRYNLSNLVSHPAQKQNMQQSPMGHPASGNESSRHSARNAQKEEVPVIPAIDGSGGSPGQRAIRSIEDIEKIYQEKYGHDSSYQV